MEQIAAAAGIAKPTLYHYFRAKDEILRGIHETFIDVLLEHQDERCRLGLPPADLLLGAMSDIFGLMETHRGHVRVFFDPEAATLAVFGVCNWAYQWWRPGGRADPAHTAQKMWDLIIRGLAPRTA